MRTGVAPAGYRHLSGRQSSKRNRVVRRAIAASQTNAIYHSNPGELRSQTGDLADARAAVETAIALKPREAVHYLNLADLKAFAEGDAHLAAMEGWRGRSLRSQPSRKSNSISRWPRPRARARGMRRRAERL